MWRLNLSSYFLCLSCISFEQGLNGKFVLVISLEKIVVGLRVNKKYYYLGNIFCHTLSPLLCILFCKKYGVVHTFFIHMPSSHGNHQSDS